MPYVVGLVFVNQKKPPGVWSGTGTIINPRGLILTANHVLKDEDWKLMAVRNFVGRGPNIFVGNYQLVEGFPEHDLALIYRLFRVFSGWPTGSRLLHPADPTSPAVTSEPKRRPRNPQIPYTPVRSWATRKGNKTLINRELSL